MVPQATKS
jgi:hypothetical protein